MCAFMRVDGFKVTRVAQHMIFASNAVAAVHIARLAGDIKGFANIIALPNRYPFRGNAALLHQPSDQPAGLIAERTVGLPLGQRFLIPLTGRHGIDALITL